MSNSKEISINYIIQQAGVNANNISDGYNTFGELYTHRITLYKALCKNLWRNTSHGAENPIWMSKKASNGSFLDHWFLLGIHRTPGLQITYHLPLSEWEECKLFATVLDKAPEWDGHTSEEVIERLNNV